MSLAELLEEASRWQTAKAVEYSPFEVLVKEGYKLYFGQNFGWERNRYWLVPRSSPADKKFVVDYNHLLHIVGNLLTPLSILKTSPYASLEESNQQAIIKNIGQLSNHLGEYLEMYESKAVDISGQTLGIPNMGIFGDIWLLKTAVDDLKSSIGKQFFEAKVAALIDIYDILIKGRYAKTNPKSHPPSLYT